MEHGKEHGRLVVVAVGTEPPVSAVVYHGESTPPDGGYTILFSDAPEEPPDDPEDPRIHTICFHCLIESHPEVGRGLDLAKKHGSADRDPETGEWYPEGEGSVPHAG
jgi:hypothetical protein